MHAWHRCWDETVVDVCMSSPLLTLMSSSWLLSSSLSDPAVLSSAGQTACDPTQSPTARRNWMRHHSTHACALHALYQIVTWHTAFYTFRFPFLRCCIFQPCSFVLHFPVLHFPPPVGFYLIFRSCIFMNRVFSLWRVLSIMTLNNFQTSWTV